MENEAYPELERFIGGWFNQDWGVFGASFEEVARDYRKVVGPERIQQACAEMDRFLVEYGSSASTAFEERWGWFNPALMGFTIASFFGELKKILNN